jgi:hypothetical protein
MLLCVLFAVYDVPKVADQKQVEAQQQDPTQEPEGHEGTVPTMFKQIAKEFKHSIPV